MLEELTRTSFEPHLNSTFQLDHEEAGALDLELTEATDKTPEGALGEQFSLIFKGPPEPYLPQQTYALEHPALGQMGLFLVPVAQEEDGFLYEAYFNRSTPEE